MTVNPACGDKIVTPLGPYVCQKERGHDGDHLCGSGAQGCAWPQRFVTGNDRAELDALTERVATLEGVVAQHTRSLDYHGRVIRGETEAIKIDPSPLTPDEAAWAQKASERIVAEAAQARIAAEEAARPAVEHLPSVPELEMRCAAMAESLELCTRTIARKDERIAELLGLIDKQHRRHEQEMMAAHTRIRALEGSAGERNRAEAEKRQLCEMVKEWLYGRRVGCSGRADERLYQRASAYLGGSESKKTPARRVRIGDVWQHRNNARPSAMVRFTTSPLGTPMVIGDDGQPMHLAPDGTPDSKADWTLVLAAEPASDTESGPR
jgi:hypothetical protein